MRMKNKAILVLLALVSGCAMNETVASLPIDPQTIEPQRFVLEQGLTTSRSYQVDGGNKGYYLFSLCSDGFPYFPDKKINMDYMKIDLSLFLGDSLLFSFSGYPTTDPFDRDMCTCFVKYQTFPNEFDLTQKMYVELSINDPNSLLDMAYNPRLLIKAGNWAHK